MSEELRNRPGDQPLPVPGVASVQDRLIANIELRKELGIERYGSPLMTYNGRHSLRDAMEEAVDQATYLTQAVMEEEGGRRGVFTETAALLRRLARSPEEHPGWLASGGLEVHNECIEQVARLVESTAALCEGAGEPGDFFVMGNTYEHAAEGIFLVKYAGRAPQHFEHHSETLGVAFGWRRDARAGAVGVPRGDCGAYTQTDFAGWGLY